MFSLRERILVTGGTGFLGANLVPALVAAGHDVHLVVRPNSDRWRLTRVGRQVTFHAADLLDRPALRRALDTCRPEVIYHLAGYGVLPSQRDRDGILEGNVLATANLLTALEGHNYRRLVQAGTSAEYGAGNEPMREHDRLEPCTDYGVAKASATLLCQAENYKGHSVATVRIFTAFGPWEPMPRLVPYVMHCCRNQEAPRLSSGRQERDFICVEDVVALLMVAATHDGAGGQILHAATGTLTSVRQVVETIIAISGARVAPAYGTVPRRLGEPERWTASIERTTALTGWRPRLDLRTALQRLWDWNQSQCPSVLPAA
jgi:nucleoside-diphosphate-sugar epimerase